MNGPLLDQIVEAVLYEGYILYPYRPTSTKNRERFTFGRVYPEAYSLAQNGAEPCVMQTECLVRRRSEKATVRVSVRFLHPMAREVGELATPVIEWHEGFEPAFKIVPELRVDGDCFQTWQEAVENKVETASLELPVVNGNGNGRTKIPFYIKGSRVLEPIRDRKGTVAGIILRRQEPVQGTIEVSALPLDAAVCRITVRILNQTPLGDGEINESEVVLMRTFASAHTVLHAEAAEFLSLMDPPGEYEPATGQCVNAGTWPVLVGEEQTGKRDTMLSSPIILYDFPQISPESPGSLFDGTEVDELLSLRILTLTDEEKRQMRQVDAHARRLLERTETLTQEQFLKLHGVIRSWNPPGVRTTLPAEPDFEEQIFGISPRLEGATVEGVYVRAGDRVRLRPKTRADVLDLALNGKTAVIEAVEQDAEKRVHLAVVLEDDPGKDLGLGRMPGHRFFYGIDEVEPLQRNES